VFLLRPFTVAKENLVLSFNETLMLVVYIMPFAQEALRLGAKNVGGTSVSIGILH
jgi:hypothetical protein